MGDLYLARGGLLATHASWPRTPVPRMIGGSLPPVQDGFGKAEEGPVSNADEVIKDILSGTLSRPKVREIGRAVSTREGTDDKGDALGRAIVDRQSKGLPW